MCCHRIVTWETMPGRGAFVSPSLALRVDTCLCKRCAVALDRCLQARFGLEQHLRWWAPGSAVRCSMVLCVCACVGVACVGCGWGWLHIIAVLESLEPQPALAAF